MICKSIHLQFVHIGLSYSSSTKQDAKNDEWKHTERSHHYQQSAKKFKLLSVNQLAAEIQITEAWKSINIKNCPIELCPNNPSRLTTDRSERQTTTSVWKEDSKINCGKKQFHPRHCQTLESSSKWNYESS